jgi:VIT1/CCC1 family predicted Fe2+/Mn2+ transporter
MIATLKSKRFLTTDERVSEALFGLIMVLTFTGSLSVARADHAEVREMLIAALGCNFAWGLIDGIIYLMSSLAEKGSKIRLWKAFKSAPDPSSAYHVLESTLPPMMSELLTPRAYEAMRADLIKLPDPPDHPGLAKEEWLGALMVFLWVFATTFPVAIPFLVMRNVRLALRVSNAIAIVLLFVTGYAFGRSAEYKPLVTGLAMVGVGCLLVGLTIELGG